jgi:hypothetical protein
MIKSNNLGLGVPTTKLLQGKKKGGKFTFLEIPKKIKNCLKIIQKMTQKIENIVIISTITPIYHFVYRRSFTLLLQLRFNICKM